MVTDDKWRDFAACKGENPNVFFEFDFVDLALSYCKECVAQPECLREAIIKREYGVRGGSTYEERQAWRMKLRKFPDRIGEVEVIVEFIE